jgi:cysteine desulfurase family protein (TIGR01976 family)
MPFPIGWVREQFPALNLMVGRQPVVYLDGPGGTQVPNQVISAMSEYYRESNANLGGCFVTSQRTGKIVNRARAGLAELINAPGPNEIIFGQNMTSLTFAFSRALSQTWKPGAEIVVTSLDHDANIAPWRFAARERGVTVKIWEFRPETGTLELDDLRPLVNERTTLIAVALASNTLGSHVDVGAVAEIAHANGAQLFVDAVHFAPHAPIDVQKIECDFLVCSAYKFFGPHIGVLWGTEEWLTKLASFKVRPASDDLPGKWETGTQSFESISGIIGTLDYLKELGRLSTGKRSLGAAMRSVEEYESALSKRFLSGLEQNAKIVLYGIAKSDPSRKRTPTFAIRIKGRNPAHVAQILGAEGLFVWNGHFYAIDLIERLGLADSGGVVRIGFVHYNTMEEVDRTLEALERL